MDGVPRAAPEPEPRADRPDTRFPSKFRIRSGSEIRGLFSRGERTRTRHLDVIFAPSPLSHSRFGVVVPRHRHRIVDRNLLKRRLREIARRDLLPRLNRQGVAVDLLVRARREAYDVGFPELRSELMEWIDRRWLAER